MTIALSIVFYFIELFMLGYLAIMIARQQRFSIKDTLVYPFIFIVAFLITFSGYLFVSDNGIMDIVPKCISDALNIVKLSLDSNLTSSLKNLGGEYYFLLGSYYGIYFVSLASLISLTMLLCITAFKNAIRIVFRWFRKELIVVFGLSEDSVTFIKNLGEKKKNTVVIIDSSKGKKYIEEKLFLDSQKVAYLLKSYNNGSKTLNFLKYLIRCEKVNVSVVTFFEKDDLNYSFVALAKSYLTKNHKAPIFVISAPKHQQSYLEEMTKDNISDNAKGKIRIFNKYDLIAYDFISNHNFAKYIDQDLINDDCTIKDCDINLYMFGYGKVGQAMLRDILINTQFVTKEEVNGASLLKPKRINVTVYDKKGKNDDINTALGFLKYNKASFNPESHLELIDNYLNESDFIFDKPVDDFNVIENIYDHLKAKNKKQVNFFIISIDSDVDNWNLAHKIKHHLDAIPNSQNVFFFRTKTNFSYMKEENMISFGMESTKTGSAVLSYDNVIKDKIYAWAMAYHYAYENGVDSFADINKKEMEERFKSINRFEKLSNLYVVANMFFKLSLMKLKDLKGKYVSDDDKANYSYDKLSKANTTFSKRDVLAFLEHERWNAFEIAYGVLPLKKDICIKISNKEGKFHRKHPTNDNYLYHLAITTQKGLTQFYDLAMMLGYPNNADVVKYDYDLVDYFLKHLEMLDVNK